MANTNLIFKDLDHLDFLEINDAASKVVGGQQLECTEFNRAGFVIELVDLGIVTVAQANTILAADLGTFCNGLQNLIASTTVTTTAPAPAPETAPETAT